MNFGPIELNILERVEDGLEDGFENEQNEQQGEESRVDSQKYEGQKEVIFVQGWIDVDTVYEQYLSKFISIILIGMSLIYSIQFNNQNFWPTAFVLTFLNGLSLLSSFFKFFLQNKSDFKIVFMHLIEFHVSLCYFIYFLGFLLNFCKVISSSYLLLFVVPHIILGLILFFYNSTENYFLREKKFMICVSVQLLLISFKFSQFSFINWDYTLIFFMAAAIYLTVLGMLLTIVLSCTVFGFLYNNLRSYKMKSITWLTWYYVWTGMVYIYLIKGVINFYNEDDVYQHQIISDYTRYHSSSEEILLITSYLMIAFSFISVIFHVLWKQEIKLYFQKVIYRKELRREVSLFYFSKNFVFPLYQISEYFYRRQKGNEEQFEDTPAIKDPKQKHNQICVICYDEKPNILFDPCQHAVVCKPCFISNVKFNNQDKIQCPFCKTSVQKIYLIQLDQDHTNYIAKGEIKLKS